MSVLCVSACLCLWTAVCGNRHSVLQGGRYGDGIFHLSFLIGAQNENLRPSFRPKYSWFRKCRTLAYLGLSTRSLCRRLPRTKVSIEEEGFSLLINWLTRGNIFSFLASLSQYDSSLVLACCSTPFKNCD